MAGKIKDENYYQISGWMINKLGLKGTALQTFSIIYGFTQDGETEFSGSIAYLCDWLNVSKPTVSKALSELVEKGYIIKNSITMNNVTFNRYKANLGVVKKLCGGSKETLSGDDKEILEGSKETLSGGSKETLPNNNIIDNNINNNTKDNNINNKKEKVSIEFIKEVIDYLNEKAGTKYQYTSKETQKHIKARMLDFKESPLTVDDFKTVIDNKVKDWKNDAYWSQYLRPQTLFGTKFESYLNKPKTSQNINNKQDNQVLTGNPFFDLLNEQKNEESVIDADFIIREE